MNMNEERRALAERAVDCFAGSDRAGEDYHTLLTDLLADLMHWAHATDGVDFDMAYDRAVEHFEYEIKYPSDEQA